MGTVNGTTNDDRIDAAFVDAQGDRISATGDTIPASLGDDSVIGGAGDDLILGGEGDDILDGGAGNDTIEGDSGQDSLVGGPGDDLLKGGTGDDTLKGRDGDDILDGQEGVDFLGGEGGNDTLRAGPGDTADGGDTGGDIDVLDLRGLGAYRIDALGADSNGNGFNGTISFLNAAGMVTGTIDFVEIEGFLDDSNRPPVALPDSARVVQGQTVTIPVLANDSDPDGDAITVFDATSTDGAVTINDDGTLTFTPAAGVLGSATITYAIRDTNGGVDFSTVDVAVLSDATIIGTDGDDVIDTTGGVIGDFDNPYPPLPVDPDIFDNRDVVFGGGGNDTIRTGDDRDSVYGGAGDDTIDAGIDDDLIEGGAGNDSLTGNEGNDIIFGGAGDDVINGGLAPGFPDSLNIPDAAGDLVTDNGQDTIYGGDGNDVIRGQDDDDVIFGGRGDDSIDGGVDDDVIFGGEGNDLIAGGEGRDVLGGNEDRDTFTNVGGGDVIDGGAGGDDFDTLDLTGSGVVNITYISEDREDGIVTFDDGSTLTFAEIETVIPCFTPGTTIATPRGERLVEDLVEGDRIITRDNGIQEIRWVGQKEMSGRALLGANHLQPVLIKAGALGHGLPERDMMVSPNHRLLVANDRTQLYFEENEVLAAAKYLVGTPGIQTVDAMKVSYIHFMFDRHEVVLSNGAWTESFQPGDYSLKGLGSGQRAEIMELFPDLSTAAGREDYTSARRSLKKHEAKLLVQ